MAVRNFNDDELKRIGSSLSIDYNGKPNWCVLEDGVISLDDVIVLNNVKKPTIVLVKNTKKLSTEVLSKIRNPNVVISVLGGFDYMKQDKRLENGNIRRTLNSPQNLCDVIKKLEKWEEKIDPNWSEAQKALYMYFNISYGIKYTDERDMDGEIPNATKYRSLQAVLEGEAVCAGFAQIFKEAMDRIGIPCVVQSRTGHHDWNIINLQGKNYLIDTSDASCYVKTNPSAILIPFGTHGYDDHHDLKTEKEEKLYNLSTFSIKEVADLQKSILKDMAKISSSTLKIKDLSLFDLKNINRCYEIGKNSQRIIRQGYPDSFKILNVGTEICSGQKATSILGDGFAYYSGADTSEAYYEIGFCNYWKRTIEKEMLKSNIKVTEASLKKEMEASLPTINKLVSGVLASGSAGFEINWKDVPFPKTAYGQALMATFTKDPVALDCLANAGFKIMAEKDANFKNVRVESSFTSNGAIKSQTYTQAMKTANVEGITRGVNI